jgi:sugar phosphate isomerase/epimerase
MKTSAVLFLTDILPEKRRFFNKIVKNRVFQDLPRDEVFETLKKSGVDGIELLLPSSSDTLLQDINEIKKALEEHHMPVLSVHQALRFLSTTKIDEIKELFEIAKTLSAKVITLHMNTAGKQLFDQQYIDSIHELQKKYNIKVGFENREKYFGSMRSKYGWDEHAFPELIISRKFNMTLDTTHLAQAGGDIIQFFKRNKDNIVNIHISDYKPHILNNSLRPLRFKHLPLGKGSLPIKEFIEMLHKEKYEGLVTMEIHTDLDGICEGARQIKKKDLN